MPEIGETLRDARMRARIDVSEIEAKTKIRAKYLRALENEEWGLLPGPTFVKSFLRTYAQALGLDGKALVEEYRLSHEGPSEAALEPIVSEPAARPIAAPGRAARRPLARLHGGGRRRGAADRAAGRRAAHRGGGGSSKPRPITARRTQLNRALAHRGLGGLRRGARGGDRDAVAAPVRAGVRVPDRRQRAQGDPRKRTSARLEHRHLPREAL